jgi:hypothetical protein
LRVVTSESKLEEVTIGEERSVFSLTRVSKEVVVTEERVEEVVVMKEEGEENVVFMVEVGISSLGYSAGEVIK